MRWELFISGLLAGSMAMLGCQKDQKAASDPIRDGIRQHLSSLKTLNLSAMDMNVTNVSVNGNTAQAQVEFVPKTGAPPGAAMRVSYSLEKRDDQWVVVKTNSLGGAIDHPAAGANPHVQPGQGDVHGNLPNFRDIIPSTTPDANGALPPGHPQIPSTQKPSP
jgi:hypothetical protein